MVGWSRTGSRARRRQRAGACIALLLLLLAALPARAQAVEFVSNFGTEFGTPAANVLAQDFTTGSNSTGYTVTGIRLNSNGASGFSASLYTTDSDGNPDEEVAALTAPASFALGPVTFTAPDGTELAPNTVYAVVLRDAGNKVRGTASDDQTGLAGWSIGDAYRFPQGASWTVRADGEALTIAVDGIVGTNRPATGLGLSGPGRVGQTLTAVTSGIADADGLTGVSYSYRWFHLDGAEETAIPGAASATYMPAASDFGRRIGVRVSFTDEAGFPETLASPVVKIRAAMPPAVCPAFTVPAGRERVWTGTLTAGEILSGTPVSVSGHGFSGTTGRLSVPKHFALSGTRYTVDGAHTAPATATPPGALRFSLDKALTDVQAANLRLHVCGESYAFADAAFDTATHSYVWPDAGLDWSRLTGLTRELHLTLNPDAAPTGLPAVSGAARVGRTVAASTAGIRDANGLAGATFTYQWIRVDGGTETEIAGATGQTYTLTAEDEGKQVRVKVSFTDNALYAQELTSADFPDGGTIAMPPDPSTVVGNVWSAKLTVKDLPDNVPPAVGCDNLSSGNRCSTQLTEDEFTLKRPGADQNQDIFSILLSGGTLSVGFSTLDGSVARLEGYEERSLVFKAGSGTELKFSDAQYISNSYRWTNTGLSWPDGSEIDLAIDQEETDNTPPALTEDATDHAVAADGRSIQLVFDEALDQANRPEEGAFTVTADGSAVAVTQVSGGASWLRLALGSVISRGQTVTVRYADATKGDAAAIQDAAGNEAADFAVTVTNGSTVAGVPGAPTGLGATAGLPDPPDGTTQIALSWTAPADAGHSEITGYRIEWSASRNGPWTELVADTGNTDRTYTDEGLPSQLTRHYRVSARNALGPGTASAPASATTADLVPPELQSAGVPEAGDRIALTFDEQPNPGAPPPVSSFTVTADGVRIGFSSVAPLRGKRLELRNLSRTIRQGQAVVVTYTDPTPDDDRRAIQDEALNDAASFTTGLGGVPAVVNESDVTPVAPGKVPNLAAEASGDTSIALAWDAPADDGGRVIASYRIEWSADGGGTWSELVAEHATMQDGEIDRRYEQTGLTPGVTRHYRVAARNSRSTDNLGAWSDSASATTPTGVPGAPTALTATAVDAMPGDATAAIRLAWSEPSNLGLSAIVGYRIEWSADGNAPWNEVVADTGSTAPEYTDGGLGSEVTRHYRVRAVNGQGPGSASGSADATTADIVPPVPVSVAVTASGTTVQISFNEIFQRITIPKSAFRVTVDGIRASIEGDIDANPAGTMWLLTGVSPTIRRDQAVVVTYTDPSANDDAAAIQDLAGNDAASFTTGRDDVPAVVNNSTIAPVAPGQVLNLAAVSAGSTAIALTWDAPADNGGRVVESYRIEGCASACEMESSWELEVAEHAAMSGGMVERRWVDTGLAPATTRQYRVRAANAVGSGAWSDSASATTSNAGTPEAPTGLTATARDADPADGATEIALSWTGPSNVIGYRIEWSADGATNWTELEDDTGTAATSFIDDMLASETTRHYRVSAINGHGTGPASDPAHATTADIEAPVLVSTGGGEGFITLTFDEPLDLAAAENLPASAITVTASGQIVSGDVDVDHAFLRGVTFLPHQRRFAHGETVVVTYTDPTAGDDTTGVIQDEHGIDAESFTTGQGGVPTVNVISAYSATAPGKVPDLRAAPDTDTSIALTWEAPADNGGAPIESYRIEVSEDGTTFTVAAATHNTMKDGAIERRYVHTVPMGATRHYRVAARNSVGLGTTWSDTASGTAITGAPDAPTDLTATAGLPTPRDGTTLIRLSWKEPSDTGDSAIKGYRVEWSADGITDWTDLEDDTETTATTFVDENLGSEVTRHYQVSAINTQGTGPPSNTAGATTGDVAGPEPVSAAVHESGNLLRITFDEALDDTSANAPPPARFRVTSGDGITFPVTSTAILRADGVHKVVGLFFPASLPVRQGQVLTVAYTDRTANDDRAGVVQDDGGNDAPSFTLGPDETVSVTNGSTVPVTAPGAPENLRAESGGNDRIVVTWDAPADTGGRAITGYRLEASSQGAGGPFTDLAASHNTKNSAGQFEYVHDGLSTGDVRWYRVTARNGADDDDVGPVSEVRQGAVDKKGDVALSVAAARVAEGGSAVWTVTAVTEEDAPPDAALQMQVTVTSADGTATAPGDYAALDETLTFQRSDFQRRNVPGVGSRWVAEKTGTVAIVDDVTVEPEKAFTLAMAVGTGGTGWVTGADGVEIALEDDDAWTVTVSADPASLVEGETRAVALTARILRGDGSAPPNDGCVVATAVEVALAVAGTAAGEGIDYTLGGDTGTRTIAACAHEATWTVQLDTAVDRVDDADETVTFTPVLQSTHAIAPIALNAATVTLRQEPGVRVSHASLEVLEGSTRTYAVSLTAPPTATVTVTARVSDNADVTVSPERLEFDAANWPTAQLVTVTAGEDADEEDDTATVEHLVSATGGYGGVTAGSVTVSVRDSTGANVWGAVRLGDRIDNADGSATGRLEVAYHGQWGTVCDDRQYLGNLTPVLACRIAGFQTGEHARNRNSAEFSAIGTDEIPIHLDDVVCLPGEHDDAVRLDQCETSSGYPGTLNNCRRHEDMWVRCSGMLPQDQTPAMGSMPKILAGDGSGMEGPYDSANPSHSGAVHFKVILTAPDPVNTITVDWATRDVPGTEPLGPDFQGLVPERATEGEDYDTPGADYIAASGTVTFAPNVTSQRVEVRIIDDNVEDAHEMFELVLSNPSGALIADGTGEGLIFNHDPLQAGFDDVPRAHGGAAFTVTLAFSRGVTASAERVKAALETIGATVTQVTGPDSEGRRFQVSVEPEGSETVTVRIAPEADCSAASAVCDENGMGLSHMASAEVAHSVAAQLAAPVVTGVPQVGQTLSAALEEAGGETVAWQWLRGEEEIAGADAATYAPVAADVGAALSVHATRGAATAVSAPTAPVWPAPANPALGPGEEELLSATLTLGASDEFPLRMGGYNRFVGGPFGEMDETSFDEGARRHVVEMVMLNELGRFVLATQGPPPPAGGLAVYWNAHRIAGLKRTSAVPGRDMLAGPSGIPRETYLPLADGTAEGVKVAVSVRRTHAVVSVTDASVTSGPGDNGTWDEDETVEAALTFSAPVTVSGGPPTLTVMLDGTRREATYRGGSGTDTLTFTWTVTESDAGAKRARVASNGLALNGATLSAGPNTAVDTGFAVAPWVTEVAIAPDASGDREWTAGETIEARVTFSEPVTVADGRPWLQLRIAGFDHPGTLGYASGSGSDTLAFAMEVPGGAFAGLAVIADSLEANGASIVSAASGLAAELGHDGSEPTAAPGDAGPGEPLTAVFHDVPASHDGTAFALELRFGEPVPASAAAPGAFAATGATVSGVRAQDERTWEVSVTPDGTGDVAVRLPARDCGETGAVCTTDGRGLAADVSATVAAHTGESAFRVGVVDLPEEHDGASDIVFRVVFNKRPAGFSYTVLRDQTLDIRQGGTELTPHVKRVRTGDDRNAEWRVTVAPDGNEDVTVAIGPFSSCSDAGAICTEDEEVIANEIDKTILGPPGLSVADARVYEAPGATVDFAVTLGRASRVTVHVDYATSDGTAVAGDDYAERSGTLAFAPGETEHTVSVLVYQDGHDEGEETLTLTLSNPRGGNAYLADATAVGTIENTDHMPKAWLARFGRTVAEQMVDAVDARFAAGRTAGVEMTLAGHALAGASPEEIEALEEREAEKRLEAFAERLKGVTGEDDEAGNDERALTGRDFLTASAFTLTAGTPEGGYGAVWGRGAASRFDGREGELSLEGEVTSVMLGADFTRELATLGLALTHSRGEGSYQGEGEGEVSSTLTGLYPYGRWELTERVSVWGIAGYGEGALTLTPEGQGPLETDMNLMMGAVGTRAVALEAPAEGGVELSVTSDAMAVRTRSEAETGERGNLAEAQADVTRLRLGLEGTWRGIGADGGATLAPTLEVGVRHDGGDAETGFGLDVGGGLAWAHPRVGLSADVRTRALLTHESDGFGERGLSGSLGFDPRPGSDRGFAMTLSQTMGAQASGGMDALLGHRHLEGLGAGDEGGLGARRLELKAGYGFAVFGDRFTATPQARLGLSESQRELGLGWRLGLAQSGPVTMELGLEGTRSEPTGGDGEAVNALMLRGTVRW